MPQYGKPLADSHHHPRRSSHALGARRLVDLVDELVTHPEGDGSTAVCHAGILRPAFRAGLHLAVVLVARQPLRVEPPATEDAHHVTLADATSDPFAVAMPLTGLPVRQLAIVAPAALVVRGDAVLFLRRPRRVDDRHFFAPLSDAIQARMKALRFIPAAFAASVTICFSSCEHWTDQ